MLRHFNRLNIRKNTQNIILRNYLKLSDFATVNPDSLTEDNYVVPNLLNGKWEEGNNKIDILDPMTSEVMIKVAEASDNEIDAYVTSLNSCSKSGLHNPLKKPERYLNYGDMTARVASAMKEPEIEDFFTKLIQRVAPKSDGQARGEVRVTQAFFENFGGDNPRFLARTFSVPGDHEGQMSQGLRWPYGPCALIVPFNFPLEIGALQLFGALYMGNKVTFKSDSKVSIVMEQCIRLMLACGMNPTDMDFINCSGSTMHSFLKKSDPRMTLFTGSQKIADILTEELKGKVKLEDAGFDWKVLGPDAAPKGSEDFEYVAHVCDQDAYAFSGQKCSAQSVLFAHENWVNQGLLDRAAELAKLRQVDDLTIGPVLTVTNERFESHRDALLKIPGAKIAWGGKTLERKTNTHNIPECYGFWEPTAIEVPLSAFVDPDTRALCNVEIFGPFQVIVRYGDSDLPVVLDALENMHNHLTAAVVSNDVRFRHHMLAHTVNGTTYAGMRARTTGAPQNHHFGPCGSPLAAGIGTAEAIRRVWSCHREIIMDELVPKGFTVPGRT